MAGRIEPGCRTVVFDSPADLSCCWQWAESHPAHPGVSGALRIARLRHAGDRDVAALAIPNLPASLKAAHGMHVVVNHKEVGRDLSDVRRNRAAGRQGHPCSRASRSTAAGASTLQSLAQTPRRHGASWCRDTKPAEEYDRSTVIGGWSTDTIVR